MRILQINAVYGFSSTGRTTMELDKALIEDGHESFVACSALKGWAANVYQIGSRFGKKVHGLLSRLIGTQGYFSRYSTRKLLKHIDSINPDVVHLRNLHGNYINVPMLLKYLAKNKIATVITLHDCWFYTGKCCYYTEDNCFKWQKQCGKCPALKKYNNSWFFDRSAKMLKDKRKLLSAIGKLAIIGVSDWLTNEAKQSIVKDATIVKRIYNWIDLDVFNPKDTVELCRELNLENKFIILGVAQTWSEKKGLGTFLNVAKLLPEATILLVGKMPQDVQLYPNVKSVGEVRDVQLLAKYYSMADVMLNPSIQETFGKVTAEALACGTPVIVYNSTACPELVGENCGYVVEVDDITAIKEKLQLIKRNTKAFYSNSCVHFTKENFNLRDRVNEYIDLYAKLLKGV